ncbi:glycosyl hydrolase family 61 domain-containing protein [Rhizoctonia solani AG-1 IA]|uniref:lytic cellulose monooxygenase (C4-dehydrogenating) n=1 Tax=Thanatephorus cucumeris (strain AG1-IA) TaxID=983506 RepID=L8WEV7_THACA|nr:glycosyl hydrolase family 61 domain-containing protein [Rhizoctonia solani AG-1 IA]
MDPCSYSANRDIWDDFYRPECTPRKNCVNSAVLSTAPAPLEWAVCPHNGWFQAPGSRPRHLMTGRGPQATSAIICNVGKTADAQNLPVNATAAVPAGTTVQFLWTDWQSDHPGPIMTYLAKCPGSCSAFKADSGNIWVKVLSLKPWLAYLLTQLISDQIQEDGYDAVSDRQLYGGPKNPGALWSAPVLGTSSLGSDESGLLGEDLRALHEPFRASYQTLPNSLTPAQTKTPPWASKRLSTVNSTWSATIPKTLQNGEYILRLPFQMKFLDFNVLLRADVHSSILHAVKSQSNELVNQGGTKPLPRGITLPGNYTLTDPVSRYLCDQTVHSTRCAWFLEKVILADRCTYNQVAVHGLVERLERYLPEFLQAHEKKHVELAHQFDEMHEPGLGRRKAEIGVARPQAQIGSRELKLSTPSSTSRPVLAFVGNCPPARDSRYLKRAPERPRATFSSLSIFPNFYFHTSPRNSPSAPHLDRTGPYGATYR